ncbi:hypothetical protein R1sor_015721 [Riccia sorocarpa]|uniref:Histone deacetylase domain-containing protein n=1 Tax=Riccia sorocarpa TaxID=122646 RepID=A0ABD3HG35_9MARC
MADDYENEAVEEDESAATVVLTSGIFWMQTKPEEKYCVKELRLNPGSWKAALLAAGTTMTAMQYIVEGHGKLAYALVRPPGHHAQPTQADGYCFLNNAGVAVQLAIDSGVKKVAVVDIDVHYGNGTAEGFYDRDDVFTISLHMPHGSWGESHPQSGVSGEVGRGAGIGYNLNIPLPNGTGDKGYEYALRELVILASPRAFQA